MSRVAEQMRIARANDAAHAARIAERAAARNEMTADQRKSLPRPLPRIAPALATAKGRSEAALVASTLLRGTEDILDRNNLKRDHSLPRRALSMASSKGRCTPDMLDSLLRFFANPADMAHGMLASFLPIKLGTDHVKALFSDPFVYDMVEAFRMTRGLGAMPTPAEIIRAVHNPATGRNGRAPGRLIIADGVTPATVPSGKRGRPSGPKYVDYLVPTADACEAAALLLTGPRPMYGPTEPGVPGSAPGAGHTGEGWFEAWCKAEAEGRDWRTLQPAIVARIKVALDAAHDAALKPVPEAE